MYNVENLVKNEVLSCQSGLVELLIKKANEDQEISDAGYNFENIENYFIKNQDTLDRIEEIEKIIDHKNDVLNTNNIIPNIKINIDSIEEELEELQEELETLQEEEEEAQEIFEWWSVSKWLYEKLKENNEPVLNTDFDYYWGRTCTGQSITMDYIIQKIAK